jgi:hypothetical protein
VDYANCSSSAKGAPGRTLPVWTTEA